MQSCYTESVARLLRTQEDKVPAKLEIEIGESLWVSYGLERRPIKDKEAYA